MDPVFVPEDKKKIDITKDSIKISWNRLTGQDAGAEGVEITYYDIKAELIGETGSVDDTKVDRVTGVNDSWTHTDLTNGQKWRYYIRAENAIDGCG